MKNNIKVQRAIYDLTLAGLANKIAKLFNKTVEDIFQLEGNE